MKKYNKIDKKNLSIAAITLRGEPLHNGHIQELIFPAMLKHDLVYIYLGGSNEPITMDNPFTIAQRITMLKIVLGTNSKIKIIPIRDIGATTKQEWVNYLAEETSKQKLEQPQYYYAGDEINAKWMINVKNPITNKTYKVEIVDRLKTGIMSGTDIRKSIINGGEDWEKHVPPVLHEYILENFPFKEILKNNPNIIIP